MDVIGSKTGDDNPNNAADTLKYDQQHNDAASIVQRAWRSHSMRKQKLSSDARWKDTIVNARMKVTKPYPNLELSLYRCLDSIGANILIRWRTTRHKISTRTTQSRDGVEAYS